MFTFGSSFEYYNISRYIFFIIPTQIYKIVTRPSFRDLVLVLVPNAHLFRLFGLYIVIRLKKLSFYKLYTKLYVFDIKVLQKVTNMY